MAASSRSRLERLAGPWCVVPAAGRGTRLRGGAAAATKAALDVGGRTLLERILAGLENEVAGFCVIVGSDESPIMERSPSGKPIRYAVQPEPLGVADAFRRASDLVAGPFVVVMGDTYYDRPLAPYVAAWKRSGRPGAVLVEPVGDRPRGPAGFVEIRRDEVTRIWKADGTGVEMWRVAGMMILPRNALVFCDDIAPNPTTGELELEDLAASLLDSGDRLLAVRYHGWRRNINGREDLIQARAHAARAAGTALRTDVGR